MAFKPPSSLRRDYLARDILLSFMGNSDVVKLLAFNQVNFPVDASLVEGDLFCRHLVDTSYKFADGFLSKLAETLPASSDKTNSVEDVFPISAPIVFDGDLE